MQERWRVNPELTLSLGLRYETQTIFPAISISRRVSARLRAGRERTKIVRKRFFRGGFGFFYDLRRKSDAASIRFNGITQQQFVVTDPTILDAGDFHVERRRDKRADLSILDGICSKTNDAHRFRRFRSALYDANGCQRRTPIAV